MLFDILVGYLLGWFLWNVYKMFRIQPEQKEIEPCERHKWVLHSVDKDIYCEVCGRRPGDML